ncbi:MAG: four helix bundle protein, partial [Patescibacteria group bacterium]
MNSKEFYEQLKIKMDQYAHFVYKITRNFPKEEMYGITSQLTRASLSVILNYIEGFARRKQNSFL